LKARSIFAVALVLAAVAVTAVASAAVAGTDAGPTARPDAGASLSASSWTDGLFGSLKSGEDGCAADRRVVIFEQQGEGRDPSRDRQVDVTRTATGKEAGDWSTRGGVGDPGRYYAEAAPTENCAGVTSDLVRPDRGDGRGANSKVSIICGTWEPREPRPKQYDECFYVAQVTNLSCSEQHLYNNPLGYCNDPNGLPCFCQTSFKWWLPGGGEETRVEVSATLNPFDGITAISKGTDPRALYAIDVKAGSYANIYPPQGEPGKAGGPLLLSESADGKKVQLQGILYKP
jgi:hypothetical protein